MVEWPGRCRECGEEIEDWSEAGLFNGGWVHKRCFARLSVDAKARGQELEELRPPNERSRQLELPMLFFLMLFHFGLGIGVIGWIILTEQPGNTSESVGIALLVVGLIMPVAGIIGVALNIISRRRIETVRQELETAGGWKPGA